MATLPAIRPNNGENGNTSEIIRATLEADWNVQAATSGVTADDVETALAMAHRGMLPLKETEPKLDRSSSRALLNALADIGQKIAPTIDDTAGQKWRVALLKALSDLPGKVAVQATQAAMHEPMRFLNEVETVIREKAEGLQSRQRVSLIRLERLLQEIERAANPPVPQIERRDDPLTNAELRAMTPEMRGLGLSRGWITQADLDAADAELSQ